MKTSILVLFCGLLSRTLQAQIPQGFTYQAVARTTTGDLLASKPLSVRLSILDGSATGTAQYVETQTVTTNAFGLFSLTVGGGAPAKGTLNSINWGSGVKFLGVEVAFDGTTNYQNLGATQLQSVPFALYAANGGTPGPQGTKGDKGDKGDQGTVGAAGSVGPTGATGPQGTKGDRGDKGDKGDTGNGAYTAGNGITITNNVIAANDDSPTNEFQTLSLSGQTLTLSNGGGSVTLPNTSLSGIPTPGDYDGDKKADISMYYPADKKWVVQLSTNGAVSTYVFTNTFVTANAVPVLADFDGDGKADLSLYDSSNNKWIVKRSVDSIIITTSF